MLLVLEIALTVFGIASVIRGRLEVFGHFIVEGVGARLMGLVLMAPLPTVFVLGFIRGFQNSQAGKPYRVEDYQDLALVEMGMLLCSLVLAGAIALCTGRRPPKQVNPDEEWKKIRAAGTVEEERDEALPPRTTFLPRR